MNFKAFLIISIAFGLGACTHRVPTVNDTSNDNPAVVSGTIADDTQEAIDIAKEVVKSDIEEAAKVVSTDVDSAQNSDLLQRMRAGFTFPEFRSKTVKNQEHWNATHKTFLDSLFKRATPFLFHIVEEIDKRGLPMELALLPAIESSFKPNAVSHSGAGGLWQFIPSTGREFGLRQDWWYDGRRDALASTNAALDYLTLLSKRYDGDWFLALAAYNAGPGTVSRAIRNNKKKGKGVRYQDLKLRLETRRYIPKMIALKNIINDPEKYGVTLPFISNEPHFEVVKLNGQIDLQKFAHDAGIEPSVLNHLNAGFKRWATSPDGPHHLLIPLNANGDVNYAEIAVQKAPAINYQNHNIAKGDSLSSIAHKYGVSISSLRTSNNLKGNNIRAGKDLFIPVPKAATVRNSNSRPVQSINTPQVHTVRKGDTLWSISRRYNINMNSLMTWNNLSKKQVLSLDQMIKLIQH